MMDCPKPECHAPMEETLESYVCTRCGFTLKKCPQHRGKIMGGVSG